MLFQTLSKTGAVFVFSLGFKQLTEDLKHFWSFEKEELLKEHCRHKLITIHKGARIYFSYLIVGLAITVALPLISPRSLPIYVYVPQSLGRNFIWLFENIILSVLCLCVFSFDYITFTFLQLTLMQFQLLNSSIRKLKFGNDQDNHILKMRLVKLIKHHIFLLNFTERLNRIMSLPIFFQMFSTVSTLCIEMYLMKNK